MPRPGSSDTTKSYVLIRHYTHHGLLQFKMFAGATRFGLHRNDVAESKTEDSALRLSEEQDRIEDSL